MIELTRHDAVYVLQMRAEENRFRPEFLAEIAAYLQSVLGLFARMLAFPRIPVAAIIPRRSLR
ncbi:MAG: hypothetical protein NTZ61_18345 [Proteobacteria bacterium]|nr:hypothetical protein [Pseudomonadota bacterium]